MRSDEQLIQLTLQGEQKAFEELITRYYRHLYLSILRIVRKDKEAEDVLQETLWQIYRSLPTYRSEGFKTWITRIAVNKAIDWNRKQRRQTKQEKAGSAEEAEMILSRTQPDQPVEEALIREEEKAAIAAILEELPDKYRSVLYRYYIEDQSYQEIAEAEALPVNTVAARLHRAKRLFRTRWEERIRHD